MTATTPTTAHALHRKVDVQLHRRLRPPAGNRPAEEEYMGEVLA